MCRSHCHIVDLFHSSGAVSSPPTGSLPSQLSSTPAPVDMHGKLLHNHLCITLSYFNQSPSLIPAFCVDTCLCIFKTKQLLNEYDDGKIVNECKWSCSTGVESVDGVTVLGKLQNVRVDGK